MASLTIRKLDDDVKRRLRLKAAEHGVSLEEEARRILARSLAGPATGEKHIVDVIAEIVDRVGGLDLELPERDDSVNPATFD